MIKMLTAHTREMDDPAVAVAEVLQQLKPEENLLAHSVGMVSCYLDYMDTGVLEALCAALPFDVVGISSLASAVPGDGDQMLLGLSVLTSDEHRFAAALASPVGPENAEQVLRDAYGSAMEQLGESPSLLFTFSSFFTNLGGDTVVATLDRISGGVPNFGTIAIDYIDDVRDPRSIYNGQSYRDAIALVLVAGEMDPYFTVSTIPEEKILKQRAVITGSEVNILDGVNGVTVMEYLESIGLASQGRVDGSPSIPVIVDMPDGTSLARAILTVLPGGRVACGGEMPEGAGLSFGSLDATDVIASTEITLKQVLETGKRNGILIFSCMSRNMTLGVDAAAEMEKVDQCLRDSGIPYHFLYAGGEMCPMTGSEGRQNRFHNFTMIVMAF